MFGAKALLVGLDARIRLHQRPAKRDVQELAFAAGFHGAEGTFALLVVGFPDGDGIDMLLGHGGDSFRRESFPFFLKYFPKRSVCQAEVFLPFPRLERAYGGDRLAYPCRDEGGPEPAAPRTRRGGRRGLHG